MILRIKRMIFMLLCALLLCAYASSEPDEESGDPSSFTPWEVSIPAAKRPRAADAAKSEEAEKRDEDETVYEKNLKAINFGTPSEIGKLIDDISEHEDPRYDGALYDLFISSTNSTIK